MSILFILPILPKIRPPALGYDFNLIPTPLDSVNKKESPDYKILIVPESVEEQIDPFDNIEDLINSFKQLMEDREKE